MEDLRYDLDPQGDTILILRRPNIKQPVWEPADEVSKLKQKNKIRRRQLFGLVFMSDTEDGHSDDENAHEPTLEPIAPTIESNVPNDANRAEAHGENAERNEVQFRLCSRHLSLASPVFKTMLNGVWKESAPPSDWSDCQVRYELTATEWDAKDFLLLMNIVHGCNQRVPLSINLDRLGRISVLVDYYQFQKVTQLAAGLWIDKLSGNLPTKYGRECVTWMFVSWVFSRSDIFGKMTLLALRTSEGGLGTIHLPFPPMLLTVMERKRDHFIDEIFNILGGLCKDLWKGRRGCDLDCRSMLLGSLLNFMDENELYGACSAEQAKSAVLSFKFGTRYVCDPYVGYYPEQSCLHKLLKPGIERLWDGLDLDGLELDDHNGQKKKSADVDSHTAGTT